MVCGGWDNHVHSIGKDESKFFGKLNGARKHAASVMFNEKMLWVTGGTGNGQLKSTEFMTEDGKNFSGPDLPLALSGHAIVALNSSVFILIGGTSYYVSSSATYFYEEKKGWRPGPNLKNARAGHTAGVLTDRVSTKQYIVAVGGIGARSSLEYLEYPGSNEWMKGKPTHSSLDQLQLESHLFMF